MVERGSLFAGMPIREASDSASQRRTKPGGRLIIESATCAGGDVECARTAQTSGGRIGLTLGGGAR